MINRCINKCPHNKNGICKNKAQTKNSTGAFQFDYSQCTGTPDISRSKRAV